MLVSLQYPLLRSQVPVPAPVHAWILRHPGAGNALFNLVRMQTWALAGIKAG